MPPYREAPPEPQARDKTFSGPKATYTIEVPISKVVPWNNKARAEWWSTVEFDPTCIEPSRSNAKTDVVEVLVEMTLRMWAQLGASISTIGSVKSLPRELKNDIIYILANRMRESGKEIISVFNGDATLLFRSVLLQRKKRASEDLVIHQKKIRQDLDKCVRVGSFFRLLMVLGLGGAALGFIFHPTLVVVALAVFGVSSVLKVMVNTDIKCLSEEHRELHRLLPP